jgi:hypothetical protein
MTAAQRRDFLTGMKADLAHRLRWRRRFCRIVTLGRHLWGEPWRVDAGPVNFEESDETLLGWFRQCRLCYETEAS